MDRSGGSWTVGTVVGIFGIEGIYSILGIVGSVGTDGADSGDGVGSRRLRAASEAQRCHKQYHEEDDLRSCHRVHVSQDREGTRDCLLGRFGCVEVEVELRVLLGGCWSCI